MKDLEDAITLLKMQSMDVVITLSKSKVPIIHPILYTLSNVFYRQLFRATLWPKICTRSYLRGSSKQSIRRLAKEILLNAIGLAFSIFQAMKISR